MNFSRPCRQSGWAGWFRGTGTGYDTAAAWQQCGVWTVEVYSHAFQSWCRSKDEVWDVSCAAWNSNRSSFPALMTRDQRVSNAFSDIGHGSKTQTSNGNDTG